MASWLSPVQAVEQIPDGATVGIGGAGLQRKPMALLRALADAGRQKLRVVSFLGSVDVELLLASGCVGELHSAGVSLEGAGLAPLFRTGRQDGSLSFVEWSEGTLLCALEAVARGVPSLPTWLALGTDLPEGNDRLREQRDPFTGDPVMQVRSLPIDVALLHLDAVDEAGHGYVEGDLAYDGALARAAGRVIASCERRREADPARVSLSRLWLDHVVHAPGGSWPTGCHPSARSDLDAVTRWAGAGAGASAELLAAP